MPVAVKNIVLQAEMVVYVRLVPDKEPYASWCFAQITKKPTLESVFCCFAAFVFHFAACRPCVPSRYTENGALPQRTSKY